MAQTTLRDRIQSIEDAISAGHIDGAMADCQELLAHYPDALEIQRQDPREGADQQGLRQAGDANQQAVPPGEDGHQESW